MTIQRSLWAGILLAALALAGLGQFILLARPAQWMTGALLYMAALALLWLGLSRLEGFLGLREPDDDTTDALTPPSAPMQGAEGHSTPAPSPMQGEEGHSIPVTPALTSTPSPIQGEGNRSATSISATPPADPATTEAILAQLAAIRAELEELRRGSPRPKVDTPSQDALADVEDDTHPTSEMGVEPLPIAVATPQAPPETVAVVSPAESEHSVEPLPSAPARPLTAHWPSALLAVTALALAAIPPLLVFQERFLRSERGVNYFRQTWEAWFRPTQLLYPPYFVAIFACFFGLLALFVLLGQRDLGFFGPWRPHVTPMIEGNISSSQRRVSLALIIGSSILVALILLGAALARRPPGFDLIVVLVLFVLGWALRELPWTAFQAPAAVWRTRAVRWGVALLVHLSLILFLANTVAWRGSWLYAIPLLLALACVAWFRLRLSPIFWVISVALALCTLYLDAWWMSTIGDEYSFLFYARDIIQQHDLAEINRRLFVGSAVYGAHPYFSSLLQALSMRLLGIDNFGWRFSSIYVSALSIGLFYAFFRPFVAGGLALTAAILLAASHYLMDFARIGYNNTQALLALGLVLWAAGWALRSQRWLAYSVTGLSMALCFYVYPAALYAVPLPFLLWLIFDPPRARATLLRWGLTVASFFALFAPLLFQPAYWRTKVEGTLFFRPELVETSSRTLYHFVSNLVYAFFQPVYSPEQSHYVVVAYLDLISAGFFFIGLCYTLTQVGRSRFALFLALSFAALLFMVGATHDRTTPSTTRMFLLLPWWTLLAAIGLYWVVERLRWAGLAPRPARVVLGALVVAILALNVYHAYPFSKAQNGGRYQSLEALWLRTAQRVFTAATPARSIVWVNDPGSLHIPALREVVLLYVLPSSAERVMEIQTRNGALPPTAQTVFADPNALIIVSPRLPDAARTRVETVVRESGRLPCQIRNAINFVHFTLWLPPETMDLCPVVAS